MSSSILYGLGSGVLPYYDSQNCFYLPNVTGLQFLHLDCGVSFQILSFSAIVSLALLLVPPISIFNTASSNNSEKKSNGVTSGVNVIRGPDRLLKGAVFGV